MKTWLQRLFNVRREEVLPVCLAVLFFFCVLVALMILRPAREALGLRGGIDAVRWLFMGTALAALLVNPLFGWLVSRLPRLQFITATYAFFACSLVGFHLLLVLTPEAVGVLSGQVFYVWFSVFNLFATMLFWALMADRFSFEQSKRLFGAIAVGGTLGAIFGPWLASVLARPFGTPSLLVVSAGFLVLALGALTSAISLLEPIVAWVEEGANISRKWLALIIGALAWVAGLGTVLSFNLWSDFHPMARFGFMEKMTLFDVLDFTTANLIMPTVGLMIALFAGWVLSGPQVAEALHAGDKPWFRLWHFALSYIAPFGVISIFVANVLM